MTSFDDSENGSRMRSRLRNPYKTIRLFSIERSSSYSTALSIDLTRFRNTLPGMVTVFDFLLHAEDADNRYLASIIMEITYGHRVIAEDDKFVGIAQRATDETAQIGR